MARVRRDADPVEKGLAQLNQRTVDLLRDVARRVKYEEFSADLKVPTYTAYMELAMRDLWWDAGDDEIAEKLNENHDLSEPLYGHDLQRIRRRKVFELIKGRLQQEFERATEGTFHSLRNDPELARQAGLLGVSGSEQTRLLVAQAAWDRADPKKDTTGLVVLELGEEFVERLRRSEEAIEATGVRVLKEKHEET